MLLAVGSVVGSDQVKFLIKILRTTRSSLSEADRPTAACHCPQSWHNKNHQQLVLFSWLIVSEGLFKSDRLDNYVMIPGRPTVHHSCQASVCWRLRRDRTAWWEQRGWHYSFFLSLATRWCWSECVWCGGKVTSCQMTSLRSLETPETGTGRDGWHKIETNTELSTLIKV